MSDGPSISGLAPWFGGKRTLASRIAGMLASPGARGRPALFVEPFAGSMAVSFAMQRTAEVAPRTHIVNDLHGDIINLARVLASDRAMELLEAMSTTLACEPVYDDCAVMLDAMAPVCAPAVDVITDAALLRAKFYAIVCWLGPNGLAGTDAAPRFCKRYTAGGGDPATRWRSWLDSLPAMVHALRRMTILREDGIAMLDRIDDDPGTSIYLDPPYLRSSRASGSYVHDFEDSALFGSDDYQRLATAASRFKTARIVVSYYDDPRLEGLYPGWRIDRIETAKNTASASGGSAAATEVLLSRNCA